MYMHKCTTKKYTSVVNIDSSNNNSENLEYNQTNTPICAKQAMYSVMVFMCAI